MCTVNNSPGTGKGQGLWRQLMFSAAFDKSNRLQRRSWNSLTSNKLFSSSNCRFPVHYLCFFATKSLDYSRFGLVNVNSTGNIQSAKNKISHFDSVLESAAMVKPQYTGNSDGEKHMVKPWVLASSIVICDCEIDWELCFPLVLRRPNFRTRLYSSRAWQVPQCMHSKCL